MIAPTIYSPRMQPNTVANQTLHIRARDARGQVADVARLARGSITAGSAPHNALVLPSPDVAPAQLRIDWDGVSSHVTITNIGIDAIDVGTLRLPPQASLMWDGSQLVRVGPYSLKLVGLPVSAANEVTSITTKPTPATKPRAWWPLIVAGIASLAALSVLIYSLLARPAEIVRFALTDDANQRRVQFEVRNARRIVLLANGQPADLARLQYSAATGNGAYLPNEQERTFALVAFNALDRPTTSQLALALALPTPTPIPNPTATPLPNDPFVAEFSFNGLNKANELSDLLLNKGDGLLIAWDVANVTGIELQPAGTFKPKDSVRVAPQETIVYTLIARNAFGEAKRSVKVVVVDARATAEAVTEANANVKATQDAIAAAQAQSGATATASARATATSIALVLADAQARATEAASLGTATAAAQSTALALGTAQAGATRQVQDATSATSTAIVQATASADTTRFGRFNGTWVNDNPQATGVTRLVISNVGASITVQAFANCAPQPQACDWGPRTQAYTDEPFLVRYDFGDGTSRTLLLQLDGARLRVQDVDSRGPVRTELFSARQ